MTDGTAHTEPERLPAPQVVRSVGDTDRYLFAWQSDPAHVVATPNSREHTVTDLGMWKHFEPPPRESARAAARAFGLVPEDDTR